MQRLSRSSKTCERDHAEASNITTRAVTFEACPSMHWPQPQPPPLQLTAPPRATFRELYASTSAGRGAATSSGSKGSTSRTPAFSKTRLMDRDPGISENSYPRRRQSRQRNAITATPIASMYVSSRRSSVIPVTPSSQRRSISASSAWAERRSSAPVRMSVCGRAGACGGARAGLARGGLTPRVGLERSLRPICDGGHRVVLSSVSRRLRPSSSDGPSSHPAPSKEASN